MFLGRESCELKGGRAASVICGVHLFRRESPSDAAGDARGTAQTPRLVRALEPAGSVRLDVLQTVGKDACAYSGSCGAGLRRVRRGTVAAVRLLPNAEACVRDARAAGAIT